MASSAGSLTELADVQWLDLHRKVAQLVAPLLGELLLRHVLVARAVRASLEFFVPSSCLW